MLVVLRYHLCNQPNNVLHPTSLETMAGGAKIIPMPLGQFPCWVWALEELRDRYQLPEPCLEPASLARSLLTEAKTHLLRTSMSQLLSPLGGNGLPSSLSSMFFYDYLSKLFAKQLVLTWHIYCALKNNSNQSKDKKYLKRSR